MTTTATLKDDGPTTTISFDSFSDVDYRLDARNFKPVGLPDNEPAIIIFEGQWLEFYKVSYTIKDDATYPSSGDSCSTKWEAFIAFVKSGGDNDWLFDLTFDKEDSTPAASSTTTVRGKIRNITKPLKYGKNVNHLEGKFEFWVGEE